jgi:hypothetical protein
MQLSPYSFNSITTINDGSNFSAYFPVGSVTIQADGKPYFVERTNAAPQYVYKGRTTRRMPIHIKMLGTIHSQIDTLKAYFQTFDPDEHKLIAKDTANSNKEWYVNATVESFNKIDGQEAVVILAVADPIWLENVESTSTWNITASGDTKVIAPDGNLDAYPILQITPTSAKSNVAGATLRNRRFCTIYNQTSRTFSDYPIDITNGGIDTSALVADNTNKCQINQGGGIDAIVTTIPYDTVTGTIPVSGMGYCGTEQISWTGKTGTTSGNLTGCTRGINGTTAAVHADNAEIKVSKIEADGGDIHVYVDGVDVNYWLNGMNGATTKVWANFDLRPAVTLTVSGSYISSDTAITLVVTAANKEAIANLPSSGLLLWESELVPFSAKSDGGLTVTLAGRGAKGTTAASHADATTMKWIEHEVWLIYGDASLTNYTVSDTNKPIFNLTSTNTSWDYDDFLQLDSNSAAVSRTGMWGYSVYIEAGLLAIYYSVGTGGTAAATLSQRLALASQTFSVMGLTAQSASATKGYVLWTFYHQAGVTHVTADGNKIANVVAFWNNTANYVVAPEKSADGGSWSSMWTEAAPASNNVWASFSQGSTSLSGTYQYLRWRLQIYDAVQGIAALEINNVTLTLDSSATPSVSLGSEVTSYLIDAKITNNTTGEFVRVKYALPLNDTLEIDTLTKKVTYSDEGISAREAVTFSTIRDNWLRLGTGNNTLQYDETGAAAVTIVVKWRDRNS